MTISQNSFLRSIVIPLFKKLNPGDVTIKHHYTKAPLRLHSFRHKGYWFYGKNRERTTFDIFDKVLQSGSTILEVGGHIGYLTMYFASKVGPQGKVYVFEPGVNNLKYIRKNTGELGNVELIEKAVSNENGRVSFFTEELTGQNNSLLPDYKVFQDNQKNANVKVAYQEVSVDAVTIDSFVAEKKIDFSFIKIDVEGAELMVLEGMRDCLTHQKPIIMVEITRDQNKVMDFIRSFGYLIYDQDRASLVQNAEGITGNVFCFHPDCHQPELKNIGAV